MGWGPPSKKATQHRALIWVCESCQHGIFDREHKDLAFMEHALIFCLGA